MSDVVRRTISVDAQLWNRFQRVVTRMHGKYKGAMSECIEEAIKSWLELGDFKDALKNVVEYIHWLIAITCKLWVDGKKEEATILAEAVRRIITYGYLSRIQPSLMGLEILAAAFVRLRSGDLIISKGKEYSECYPWSLICQAGNKYLVRLIIHRCIDEEGYLLCGSDACPCIDLEDCEKVEIEEEVTGSLDEALNTLARLYLSYFFSERAYEDRIGPRAEIHDEYQSIRRELEERGILINIGPRDKKKIEEIRARKHKKQKKMHSELMKNLIKFYKDELPKEIDKWEREFKEKFNTVDWSFMPESYLWDAVGSLDILYLTLSRIYEKSKKIGTQEICGKAVNLLDEALKLLSPSWAEGEGLSTITKDPIRIRDALEKLKELLDLIKKNAVELVKTDVDEGAIAYSDPLYANIESLVKAIAGIESYLRSKRLI